MLITKLELFAYVRREIDRKIDAIHDRIITHDPKLESLRPLEDVYYELKNHFNCLRFLMAPERIKGKTSKERRKESEKIKKEIEKHLEKGYKIFGLAIETEYLARTDLAKTYKAFLGYLTKFLSASCDNETALAWLTNYRKQFTRQYQTQQNPNPILAFKILQEELTLSATKITVIERMLGKSRVDSPSVILERLLDLDFAPAAPRSNPFLCPTKLPAPSRRQENRPNNRTGRGRRRYCLQEQSKRPRSIALAPTAEEPPRIVPLAIAIK